MKISVLIPTHNRPQFFEMCLKSAVNQKYHDLEIIVSDDSTVPNYAEEIVNKYKCPFLKYLKKDSTGPTDNYISLLKHATGGYAIFLEDDDFFTTDSVLSKYADLFFPEVTGILFQYMRKSEIKKFFQEKKYSVFSSDEFFLYFPHRENPCDFQLGQLMFKTEIIKGLDYSKFTESPFLDEVTLFFLSLNKGLIIESSEVCFFLNVHDNNMTWGNEKTMINCGFKHIEEISILAKKTIPYKHVEIWRSKMILNYSGFFQELQK